jgi:hypothetical protein
MLRCVRGRRLPAGGNKKVISKRSSSRAAMTSRKACAMSWEMPGPGPLGIASRAGCGCCGNDRKAVSNPDLPGELQHSSATINQHASRDSIQPPSLPLPPCPYLHPQSPLAQHVHCHPCCQAHHSTHSPTTLYITQQSMNPLSPRSPWAQHAYCYLSCQAHHSAHSFTTPPLTCNSTTASP